VGINPPLEYNGPAYLGDAYSPFTVSEIRIRRNFRSQHWAVRSRRGPAPGAALDSRQNLDTLERAFDKQGTWRRLDEFEARALSLLTNPQTKEAFDLSREDDRTRDRYGRNAWGQQLLLARRLVESGCGSVDHEPQRPALADALQNWDDHAVNHNVFEAMRFRAAAYDQAVSALIEDVFERGLDKRVLVVVTGNSAGRRESVMQPAPAPETPVRRPGRSSRDAITGRGRFRTSGPAAGSNRDDSSARPTSGARTRSSASAARATSPGDHLSSPGDRFVHDTD